MIKYFLSYHGRFYEIFNLAQSMMIRLSVYYMYKSAFDFLMEQFSNENTRKRSTE